MTELEKLKMDDEYITQNDIVQRYLQNKLTPEETVEFEEYMLDKPELLEQLELDSILVEHFPKTFKDNKKTASNRKSWWTPRLSNITAIAASIALVAVLWFDNIHEPIPNFSPNIVYLENYRSVNKVTTLTFKQGESFKIIAIDVPPNSGNEFELKIVNSNGHHILEQKLRTNENNEVTFLLYNNELAGNSYKLELINKDQVVSAFELNFINYVTE